MTTITDAHREAKRRIEQVGIKAEHHPSLWNLLAQALAEDAWTPPVDPDLIEAREIVRNFYPEMPDNYSGRRVQAVMVALKRSKA